MKLIIPLMIAAICLVWFLVYFTGHLKQENAVMRRAARKRWLRCRTTDAERQAAIEAVNDAYVTGQLAFDEHSERVAAVMLARTNAEVQHELRDLGNEAR